MPTFPNPSVLPLSRVLRRALLLMLFASMLMGRLQAAPNPPAAPLPPMGWNSWNCFGGRINEKLLREVADALVSSGLRDAGFVYLCVDDIWHQGQVPAPGAAGPVVEGRDADGRLLADPKRFPSGIKALAEYVHARGLKFGLYTVPGARTCAGRTGSLGHEALDVATFAEWGVDFIKLDSCGHNEAPRLTFERWRKLIDAAPRPIVLSVNLGGPVSLRREYADMWRTTADIERVFRWAPDALRAHDDVVGIIDQQVGLERFHGGGRWNDPDMLQVGNPGLSQSENEAHFAMWAVLGAPLILGNDVRAMSTETRALLTNPEIIAINQDPAGAWGTLIAQPAPEVQLWMKPLVRPGEFAAVWLNRGDKAAEIETPLAAFGASQPVFFRDALSRRDVGLKTAKVAVRVPARGAVMLRGNTPQFLPTPVLYRAPALDFSKGPIRFEAESDERVRFYFSRREKQLPGWSGNGYINNPTDAPLGIWMHLTVDIAEAGDYRLSMRCRPRADREVTLALTHVLPLEVMRPFGNIVVPAAANTPDWQTYTSTVRFEAGRQMLHIRPTDRSLRGFEIDWLELEPVR